MLRASPHDIERRVPHGTLEAVPTSEAIDLRVAANGRFVPTTAIREAVGLPGEAQLTCGGSLTRFSSHVSVWYGSLEVEET